MSIELKNIVRVACIYATSIIGAGFASGQEIMQFFSAFRTGGFYGILLAGFLFAVIGSIILDKVYSERVRNYEEFLFPTFGWWAGWLIDIAVTIFMLCMFCIMIAGSGDVLSDRLGIPFNYSALLMGLICMVLIMTNIKGIVTLSTIVTPILVIGIIVAGFYIIFFTSAETFQLSGFLTHITGNWVFSSLLYISYNSIPAIVIMCSLLPYLKTRRTAIFGGILGGVLLCIAALIINIVLYLFYPTAQEKELPILAILKNFSSTASNLYAIVLWLAMLVSAVTSGFCFTDRIGTMFKADRRLVTLILCAASVPLSTIGFSRLISAIYPVFGYLGLFMIIVIMMQGAVRLCGVLCGRYGRK